MADIEGRITYAGSLAFPCPTGMLSLIAEDGTHHVPAKLGGGNFVQIAALETLTAGATALSEATIESDIAAQLGVIEDTDPPAGGSGFFAFLQRIGCPGTSKFAVLVQNFSNDENQYQVFGLVYSIQSEGVVSIAHKLRYLTNGNALIGGQFGGALGQQTIGDEVHFIADCETDVSAEGSTDDNCHLLKLPISQDEVILTPNAWAAKRYDLPGDMGFKDWWPTSAGDQKNVAALFQHTDGTAVLAYRTSTSEPTVLYMTVVNTNIAAPGTNTGMNDISSLLGIPFPDEGINFAGDPSIFGDDWYSISGINDLPGDPSRIEIWFGRSYSDSDGRVGIRRVTCRRNLTDIQSSGLIAFDLSDIAGNNSEAIHVQRLNASQILIMIREDSALTFRSVAFAVDDCPSSGFDLVYPPCVTAWTQCVKIQRRDGVTFRFTSLDQDIQFRGETYVTCGGLDPSATQITAQLGEIGSTELGGLITATGVEEAELYGGLFDDAFVEIWLVPFDVSDGVSSGDGDLPRRLAAGWAGKVSHSTRGYKMEVLGPGARLDQRPIVQVYSPQCRWVFGDERCTIDIDALAITGSVTSGINRGLFLATLGPEASSGTGAAASSGELTAQFANGRVRWLTGVNAGQVTEVKSVDFDTGQIILWALTCFVPGVGDSFDLLPGCAQDFATCRDLYDNAINFGGFPYVPGRDAISETPNAKI